MIISNLSGAIICDVKPTAHNFCDLTGDRFGRLTVIKLIGRHRERSLWLCSCDCGGEIHATVDYLKQGKTKSCGCFKRSVSKTFLTTHGESGNFSMTPEYTTFSNIKTRCVNPNSPGYSRYGGRGIEFRFSSFQEFLAEVGRKPTIDHSIDRIDYNGHYERGNVRWATKEQQANNTSFNVNITLKGETKTLAQWARFAGIPAGTLRARRSRGWCESCLTNPIGEKCGHKG